MKGKRKNKKCALCEDIDSIGAELKLEEGLCWCGEKIVIWKEGNKAYLGYEGSAFPIKFCPYCGKRIAEEEKGGENAEE